MEIKNLSNEQLAGQRLMVGFNGTRLNNDLKLLIDRIKAGGIILFAGNLSSPQQIKDLCLSAQEYAFKCGQPALFIAIDQEGGQVARLKPPFTQFPGNPKMKGEEDAINFARVTAKELKGVGINMNMAPVLDVAQKGINSVMTGRAFGSDPAWVSKLGINVIENLQQNNIMAVAKHFPGIGHTSLDSHLDMPTLKTELTSMESVGLLPFRAAIKHDVAGIMLSHILCKQIDPDWPASLSVRIAVDILRKHMGFKGIIITDDLDMGAIKKRFDIKTIIRQILAADIDIALICHKGPNIELAFNEILNGLKVSNKTMEKGKESVRKILNLKKKYLN